ARGLRHHPRRAAPPPSPHTAAGGHTAVTRRVLTRRPRGRGRVAAHPAVRDAAGAPAVRCRRPLRVPRRPRDRRGRGRRPQRSRPPPLRPDPGAPHGPAVAEVVAASQTSARPTARSTGPGGWSLTAHLRLTSLADAPTAISRLRRMLDLDADPGAVDEALADDDLLSPLIDAAPGARVPGAVDAHALAVRAGIGQQSSVSAARTHLGRLVDRAGIPVRTGMPGLTALFPAAERLAEAVAPVP